jgi:hypothetical protein
MVSQRYQ